MLAALSVRVALEHVVTKQRAIRVLSTAAGDDVDAKVISGRSFEERPLAQTRVALWI
jgi:hypothetical protein